MDYYQNPDLLQLKELKEMIICPQVKPLAVMITGAGTGISERPRSGRPKLRTKSGRRKTDHNQLTQKSTSKPAKDVRPDPLAGQMAGAPTTPDAKYCAEVLGAALKYGLAEIAERRPRDPIEYLAQFLYNYRKNIDHHWENEDLKTQLKREEEEFAKETVRKEKMKQEGARMKEAQKKHVTIEVER